MSARASQYRLEGGLLLGVHACLTHLADVAKQEGSDDCYGHYDMLMGVRAPQHVFAPIHTWLREVDEVRARRLQWLGCA